MYSQRGKVLFPHWVIVSLARLHQAKRLKECLMFNKGWLLKIKRHLLKTSPSLPSERREPSIYGDFVKFISPSNSPSISPITQPLLIESMKMFMSEKGGD